MCTGIHANILVSNTKAIEIHFIDVYVEICNDAEFTFSPILYKVTKLRPGRKLVKALLLKTNQVWLITLNFEFNDTCYSTPVSLMKAELDPAQAYKDMLWC